MITNSNQLHKETEIKKEQISHALETKLKYTFKFIKTSKYLTKTKHGEMKLNQLIKSSPLGIIAIKNQ